MESGLRRGILIWKNILSISDRELYLDVQMENDGSMCKMNDGLRSSPNLNMSPSDQASTLNTKDQAIFKRISDGMLALADQFSMRDESPT